MKFKVGDVVMVSGNFGYEGPYIVGAITKRHHILVNCNIKSPFRISRELESDMWHKQDVTEIKALKKIWTPEVIDLAVKLFLE